jgi:hypothetical protein
LDALHIERAALSGNDSAHTLHSIEFGISTSYEIMERARFAPHVEARHDILRFMFGWLVTIVDESDGHTFLFDFARDQNAPLCDSTSQTARLAFDGLVSAKSKRRRDA